MNSIDAVTSRNVWLTLPDSAAVLTATMLNDPVPVARWTRKQGFDPGYVESLRTHMYWKTRELFRKRLLRLQFAHAICDARWSSSELGAAKVARALASASLGLLRRED